jgi:hypothetical protein
VPQETHGEGRRDVEALVAAVGAERRIDVLHKPVRQRATPRPPQLRRVAAGEQAREVRAQLHSVQQGRRIDPPPPSHDDERGLHEQHDGQRPGLAGAGTRGHPLDRDREQHRCRNEEDALDQAPRRPAMLQPRWSVEVAPREFGVHLRSAEEAQRPRVEGDEGTAVRRRWRAGPHGAHDEAHVAQQPVGEETLHAGCADEIEGAEPEREAVHDRDEDRLHGDGGAETGPERRAQQLHPGGGHPARHGDGERSRVRQQEAHADRGQPPRPLPPRQRGDRDAGRGGEDQMIPAAEQRVERLARMTREPDAERRRHHAARGRERSSRRSARQVEEHEGTRDGEQTARLDEDAERGAQRLGDGRRGGRAPQGVEERARHSLEEVGLHDPVRVGLESAPRVGAVRLAPVHAARRPTSHALEVFAVPPPCQA